MSVIGGRLPRDFDLDPLTLNIMSHVVLRTAVISINFELGQLFRFWLSLLP